jgi:hypothetical protein
MPVLSSNPHAIESRLWRFKHRHPCRTCGLPLPYPSPGRMYHADCMRKSDNLNGVYAKIAWQRRAKQFATLKLARGCDRCGYNRCASALDFHHTDPMTKERRIRSARGMKKEEADKCELLCKNCHYETHEAGRWATNGRRKD